MLPQSRLDKISEMENLLNEAESFLAEAEQFLEKWQAFLPKMKTLEHYYFDGDWREDYQAYEDGKIPEDMPCGVLSEDLVFNASTGHHSLAIEYLKVVAKVLDNGFEESAHLSSCGSLDMYEIMKALHDNGFDGYIRPDHGRMIWGETGRPGYGLYDRALGAVYINGLIEAINKNKNK